MKRVVYYANLPDGILLGRQLALCERHYTEENKRRLATRARAPLAWSMSITPAMAEFVCHVCGYRAPSTDPHVQAARRAMTPEPVEPPAPAPQPAASPATLDRYSLMLRHRQTLRMVGSGGTQYIEVRDIVAEDYDIFDASADELPAGLVFRGWWAGPVFMHVQFIPVRDVGEFSEQQPLPGPAVQAYEEMGGFETAPGGYEVFEVPPDVGLTYPLPPGQYVINFMPFSRA